MSFDFRPVLEGELPRLRPLRPEDFDDLYAVPSDPLRSVVFLVGPGNVRSQRAMEKIGGVRAGSRLDGKGRESLVYRIGAV